jgi:hypothetical protein
VSRKPIDKQQPSECRQAIWEWIKAHVKEHGASHAFFLKDIDVKLEKDTIRDYLTGLFNAGYLGVYNDPTAKLPKGTPMAYYFKEDCGHDAPRVRRDGTPVTQGQGRQQMWNAMRILKVFRPVDLAFNASTDDHTVAESEAVSYCAALCKAGYLSDRPAAGYMLLPSMWTGPHPPQIQRTKQVYDPNLRRVVWARIEGGAE